MKQTKKTDFASSTVNSLRFYFSLFSLWKIRIEWATTTTANYTSISDRCNLKEIIYKNNIVWNWDNNTYKFCVVCRSNVDAVCVCKLEFLEPVCSEYSFSLALFLPRACTLCAQNFSWKFYIIFILHQASSHV